MYEDQFIRMEYVEGVVIAYYKPYVYVDIDDAKQIVVARKEIANHQPHAVLVHGGPIEPSPAARKYALTRESSELIEMWAIVDKKNMFKNVFLKLLFATQGKWNKIRFFETKDSALNWLIKNREFWSSMVQNRV